MQKNRLEAFSDGVIAIIITIMVLNLKIPDPGKVSLSDLRPILPVFFSYVLSYVYVGIYWNNHHHMLHATKHVSGGVLWANLHLLFWLSLFPFMTGWMGGSWLVEEQLPPVPTALYGFVLLMAGFAYYILQSTIIHKEGRHATLAAAVGADWKGKISVMLYALSIPIAFVQKYGPWISNGVFVVVALIWLVPDRRIERLIERKEE
jgi:uncharacterized membrane protein